MALPTRRLHQTGDPYPVLLGSGLLQRLGPGVARLWRDRKVAVVSEKRILKLHGEQLRQSFERAGLEWLPLTVPPGEASKNLACVERLYDQLIRRGFGRDDALIAFGGGSVGDTTGFVAATYLRGIAYAQVPTTLLAQIDSAIGAKVGVNHALGKNLIGAIYRPQAVWLDPALLRTLPAREFRSGLFELLKYGFIREARLFRQMERQQLRPNDNALFSAIATSVRCKLAVVREDEGEKSIRRILNFGHTIGHGLEAAGGYKLLRHGEAVGWGMIAVVRLAHRQGTLSAAMAERMEKAVRRIGPLPSVRSLPRKRVLDAMASDKKKGRQGFRVILPTGLGRVTIVEGFPESELSWALNSIGVGKNKR